MEQDPRIRPMSPEENAAYRGVTVDESGAEPQDEARHGSAYGGGRSSVRYIRLGTGIPRRSLFLLCRAARNCHDSRGCSDRRNGPPAHRSEQGDVLDRAAAVWKIERRIQ